MSVRPYSCDTFVALPPASNGCVIFGKNSDRPSEEVQEVVYVAGTDHAEGATVQCTYISIPQVSHTNDVILSKPAWLWGAEMGANQHSVCIGNEAIWTEMCDSHDTDEKLLGMDFVRLGLERAATAREALDVITSLLAKHGQGGPCFESPNVSAYQNSFIIADANEAWVLETAGQEWAAEKVTSGVRNISNMLSIGTQIDAMSDGLKTLAQSKGLWKPDDGQFNFAQAFSSDPTEMEDDDSRYCWGKRLMKKEAENGDFDVSSMFRILRHVPSGICMNQPFGYTSTGSQVSRLVPSTGSISSYHWFTATPNPACSLFKPFMFCPDASPTAECIAPYYGDTDPIRVKPRFRKTVDRRHTLYKAHQKINPLPGNPNSKTQVSLRKLEAQFLAEMQSFISDTTPSKMKGLTNLFKNAVAAEIKLYN